MSAHCISVLIISPANVGSPQKNKKKLGNERELFVQLNFRNENKELSEVIADWERNGRVFYQRNSREGERVL